jgi:hypothetical protein
MKSLLLTLALIIGSLSFSQTDTTTSDTISNNVYDEEWYASLDALLYSFSYHYNQLQSKYKYLSTHERYLFHLLASIHPPRLEYLSNLLK